MQLNKTVNHVKREVGREVHSRLKSFENLSEKEWFSELCFCILTANSKAETALEIQKELGFEGFFNLPFSKLSSTIRKNKHRFHNNKARYIIEARKFKGIKKLIFESDEPREWLVENVKGLGYKEASHFLRNVGYKDYAILDRHILNVMLETGMLENKPKSLNKKIYFEIEKKFKDLAKKLCLSAAELDFYLWYTKTGKILK